MAEPIVGHWFYYKKIYGDVEIPEPPEATLRLHFAFYADGTNRLWWWHEGEDDLCERKGVYEIRGDHLIDEVTWVNPNNHLSCGSDPDMQVGRRAITPISFEKDEWHLHLFLGETPLVYVWRRQ